MTHTQLVIAMVSLKELQDSLGMVLGFRRWFGQFHNFKLMGVHGHWCHALVIRFLGLEIGLNWIEKEIADGNDLPH